jgi:hypothetical protein
MAYTKDEIKKLLEGRTPEQQKVIRYFTGGGGCLSGSMADEEYEALVKQRATSMDFRQKALDKIGVDESQVNEIEPVHFEAYLVEEKRTFAKLGKDRKWRSSAYQITWLFFSSTQVYVYQYTFNMDEDSKKENTEDYFYKDVTNFSASSDTVEKEIPEETGCMGGEVKFTRKTVEMDKFALVVPGDKFYCAMRKTDETEKQIQAMKAKLREKKG